MQVKIIFTHITASGRNMFYEENCVTVNSFKFRRLITDQTGLKEKFFYIHELLHKVKRCTDDTSLESCGIQMFDGYTIMIQINDNQ